MSHLIEDEDSNVTVNRSDPPQEFFRKGVLYAANLQKNTHAKV